MKKIFSLILVFGLLYYAFITIAGKGYNTYTEGDYHSTLHADAAGYNVYLTALTPFDYKGKFAEKQDEKCGYGFTLDTSKKVITKYNYGVALLQSPFYFGSKYYAKFTNQEFTGYNPLSQKTVDLAGIFYSLLGLFLLYFFLQEYVNKTIALFAVASLFLTLNVFWYTLVQPGMSHVYSFFMFSLYLLLAQKYISLKNWKIFILLCLTAAMIMLIRPINALFLPILFFLPSSEKFNIKNQINLFISVKNIAIAIVCFAVVATPQIVYWKFAYGEYFPDTYPNEKFSNLFSPTIIELFFAAKSGLFLYNPGYLLFFGILLYFAIRSKDMYFKVSLLIFLILSYLTAAWYEYFFGCGFGNRNYVEYSVLLVYPIAIAFQKLSSRKFILSIYILTLIGSATVNIKLTESFDMCFFGKDIWDYSEYKYLLLNHYVEKEVDYDTETNFIKTTVLVKDPNNEKNNCSSVEPTNEFASTVSIPVNDIGYIVPRKVEFSVEVNPIGQNFTSEVAVQVMRNKEQIYFQSLPFSTIDPIFQKMDFYAPLPKELQKGDEILFFFWNKNKNTFLVDNYKFKFK